MTYHVRLKMRVYEGLAMSMVLERELDLPIAPFPGLYVSWITPRGDHTGYGITDVAVHADTAEIIGYVKSDERLTDVRVRGRARPNVVQ